MRYEENPASEKNEAIIKSKKNKVVQKKKFHSSISQP